MAQNHVDERNKEQLCSCLTQALLFCEHINYFWAKATQNNHSGWRTFQKIINQTRKSLSHQNATWDVSSELVNMIVESGVSQDIQPHLIDQIAHRILSTRGFSPQGNPPPSDFISLPESERLSTSMRVYDIDGALSFADHEIEAFSDYFAIRANIQKSYYIEEAVNPIETIKDFLSNVVGVDDNIVNHYVQFWIREVFRLKYNGEIKYALAEIVKSFNELFYNVKIASTSNKHAVRSNTFGVSLLFHKIREELENRTSIEPKDSLRAAIGIYYLFRFCSLLRVRVVWLNEAERRTRKASDAVKIKRPEDSIFTLGEEKDWGSIWQASNGHMCVTAMRPLEYTYFQTRAFGAISGIKGLNFIFRGGLLPHRGEGRAFLVHGPQGAGKTNFALHLLADMATRGRIAFYFSFEESYETIIDRLVTFGLVDTRKYEVQPAPATDDELNAVINKVLNQQSYGSSQPSKPARGLLLIFTNFDHSFSLIDMISKLADIINTTNDPRKRWRAFAIDSINALAFWAQKHENDHYQTTSQEPNDSEIRRFDAEEELLHGKQTYSERKTISALLEAIVDNNFWGILLSEHSDDRFSTLPYLAGTVIGLGFSETHRSRWIEIEKCRPQSYHPGRHPFRISDGQGIKIYPSVSAYQATLRRRGRTTVSMRRKIPIPDLFINLHHASLSEKTISEKTTTLLWGPSRSGKTQLLLSLLTEPSRTMSIDQESLSTQHDKLDLVAERPPANILVVTFRTSEIRYQQMIRRNSELNKRWNSILTKRLRWYSPGDNFTGAQIISELWDMLIQSRRQGIPIDRVAFDEVEVVHEALPLLKEEPHFWQTIIDMYQAEAVTTFIAATIEADSKVDTIAEKLEDWVDYSFYLKGALLVPEIVPLLTVND